MRMFCHSLGLTFSLSCPLLTPKFTVANLYYGGSNYLTFLRADWKSLLGPRSTLLSWSNVNLIGSQILLALIIQACS